MLPYLRFLRAPDGTTWCAAQHSDSTSRIYPAVHKTDRGRPRWSPAAGADPQNVLNTEIADWERIPSDDRIAHLAALLTPVLDQLPAEQAAAIRAALAEVVEIPDEARHRRALARR